MPGENFEHLSIPMILSGRPRLGGGGAPSEKTIDNRNNRNTHGSYIRRRTSELSRFWKERRNTREGEGLPIIESGIPILLEIDPDSDIEFLRGLGFEIVCEIEEGFIIVASEDADLVKLNEKTDEFIANLKARCNTPARIYALCEDNDRLKRVLSKELYDRWAHIGEDEELIIDIGVSCSGETKLPERPSRKEGESDRQYSLREERWQEKFEVAYIAWDDLRIEREDSLEKFINSYDGEIMSYIEGSSDWTDLPDSFSARLRITGSCLRDLVLNYAYIFEVVEGEEIKMPTTQQVGDGYDCNIEVIPPEPNSPIVCVVDSGIQEEHRYLTHAVVSADSQCLVPGCTNVSDEVCGGGHGTRVAGAVLYAHLIPDSGEHQQHCRIRNVKVLNQDNSMPVDLFPPKVISWVVDNFACDCEQPSKIYNHSIGSNKSCELKHMSSWAAEIDMQSYQNDVLFIQAAGNVSSDVISAYLKARYPYPQYLDRELARICDPAQSLQALTVGSISICDYETEDSIALGRQDEISSFSRTGPGIWDVIKPEVVEYGGTEVVNKDGDDVFLTTPKEVCPNLLRRSPEGPAFAQDEVGTSYAAPKVAHIAAAIEKVLPSSPALLYRALIAQSARWPGYPQSLAEKDYLPTLRHMGYGVPDFDRATYNNEYRITLVTPESQEIGVDEAHIFQIPIPEEIRSVGEDFDILVEISLSYVAKPRRTRRHVKGYLSSWVDWCCSKAGEAPEVFAQRILETGASIDDDGDFQWVLGEASNRGAVDGFSRKKGTLQKDWCIAKSNQLTDGFCIAVRGHKGWGSLFKAKYCLAVSFEAINQDVPVYEPIRSMIELEVENQEIEVETTWNDR